MSGQACSRQWSRKLNLVRLEIGFPKVKTLYGGKGLQTIVFYYCFVVSCSPTCLFSSPLYELIRYISRAFSAQLNIQYSQADIILSSNFLLCSVFNYSASFSTHTECFWHGGTVASKLRSQIRDPDTLSNPCDFICCRHRLGPSFSKSHELLSPVPSSLWYEFFIRHTFKRSLNLNFFRADFPLG